MPPWRARPASPVIASSYASSVAARPDKGWSLTDMWRACGITVSELSRIERGGRDIRHTSLIVLAETLDVPPGDLLEGLSTGT